MYAPLYIPDGSDSYCAFRIKTSVHEATHEGNDAHLTYDTLMAAEEVGAAKLNVNW